MVATGVSDFTHRQDIVVVLLRLSSKALVGRCNIDAAYNGLVYACPMVGSALESLTNVRLHSSIDCAHNWFWAAG